MRDITLRIMKVVANYALVAVLALLLIFIVETSIVLQAGPGYAFLLVGYVCIFLFQVLFYHFTGTLPSGWKKLSFTITEVLWITEQVIIADHLDSFGAEYNRLFVVLSGMLWVTNKMVVDRIITIFLQKKKTKYISDQ